MQFINKILYLSLKLYAIQFYSMQFINKQLCWNLKFYA